MTEIKQTHHQKVFKNLIQTSSFNNLFVRITCTLKKKLIFIKDSPMSYLTVKPENFTLTMPII